MKNIYLIRHCKAAGQESTAALTNEGKQQALDLAEFLLDIDIELIVTSPYLGVCQASCRRPHTFIG